MPTTYTVAPFSGTKFLENEARLKAGETPCAICGKAVARPFKHSVVVVDGGSDWARTEAEEKNDTDPGYMGTWGVGPECHRKYVTRA